MIDMLLVRNRILLSSIKKSILRIIYRKRFFYGKQFYFRKGIPISSQGLSHETVSIGRNCWIGSNCVIGAGCVISKNIPDQTIVRLNTNQTQEKIIYR